MVTIEDVTGTTLVVAEYRAEDRVNYFEIDDPTTVELKWRCCADARIDPGVTLIPGNDVADNLIKLRRRSR